MCKIPELQSHIQLHCTFSCCNRWKQKCIKQRPWTISKREVTFYFNSCKAVRRRVHLVRCLDRFLPGEARVRQRRKKLVSCVVMHCCQKLFDSSWYRITWPWITLMRDTASLQEFPAACRPLAVLFPPPVKQWKKVIIVPVSPYLSDGSATKMFNSADVHTGQT